MKRFLVLTTATIAAVVPFTISTASAEPAPAEYRAECESTYQAGKPIFDPLITSPLKALFGPVEAGLCGERNHVPS